MAYQGLDLTGKADEARAVVHEVLNRRMPDSGLTYAQMAGMQKARLARGDDGR